MPSNAGRGIRLDSLLAMPVEASGDTIGRVSDVVINSSSTRVLGVEVVLGSGRRFVPWLALAPEAGGLCVTSASAALPDILVRLLSHGVRLSRTANRSMLEVDPLGRIQPRPSHPTWVAALS